MVLLKGQFSSASDCEMFFESDEWYYKDSDVEGKKIVPLFPYLQKMQVHRHVYSGCIVADDIESGTDKYFMAQVILEVSGHSEGDVKEEIIDGDWLRRSSGLTVYPPVVMVKGYKGQTLTHIELDIRDGEYYRTCQ